MFSSIENQNREMSKMLLANFNFASEYNVAWNRINRNLELINERWRVG